MHDLPSPLEEVFISPILAALNALVALYDDVN